MATLTLDPTASILWCTTDANGWCVDCKRKMDAAGELVAPEQIILMDLK